MNTITQILQNDIIEVMDALDLMQIECKNIYDAYWKTDANTTVSGLSTDVTPATVASNLTKKNYQDGITLAEQLNKFFTNQAITQADYLQTCVQIQYGNADLETQLTEATEKIGNRVLQFALDVQTLYKKTQMAVSLYYDEEIGDCVGVMDAHRILYGSDMIISDLASAITLFQEFKDFMTNATVTTADYSTTVGIWDKYEII